MRNRLDLVVLVADKDAEVGFRALLRRHRDLRTRPFSFDVFREPMHDPAVYRYCHHFLRDYQRTYSRTLVVFDREGSGAEDLEASELEREVEERLGKNGWLQRCAALVLDPELEAWVWLDSAVLARHLRISRERLREILGEAKPKDPKAQLEKIWREKGIRRSSAFYQALAQEVNFHTCRDRAFRKFLRVLRTWFPTTAN